MLEISWNIRSMPQEIYGNTRFYVVDIENPSFDAILSKESIENYGLLNMLLVS